MRTAIVAFFSATALCAQQPAPLPLRGELPAIATVGDVPAENTLTIEVHDDGTLTVGALPLSYDELQQRVRERAAALPGEELGGLKTSALNVHVRAAAALPLAAVQQVVMTCVDPGALAPRVFYGVRHEGDGREGAFAHFLAMDRPGRVAVEPPPDRTIDVLLRAGDDGDPAGLAAALAKRARSMDPDELALTPVLVEGPGDLRWSVALGTLDAAARAGFARADFVRTMTPEQRRAWNAEATRHDLRALVAAAPAVERVGCRVGPATTFAAAAPEAPARVAGAFAGFAELTLLEPPAPPPPPRPGVADGRIDPAAAATIARGLRWLATHQDADGKWDSDGFMRHDRGAESCDGPGEAEHDVGVTGLALLAFLADGNTLDAGPYKEVVAKAAAWLQKQQQANGLIGSNQVHDFIYGHAIATLALVEVYGLSDAPALKATAQNAVNYLETHRNPYSVWRYQPRDNDNDTAVTSWCLHAYVRGREHDLKINRSALELAGVWLDQVSDPSGHHGYTKRGEPSARLPGDHAKRFPPDKNEAMTGTALFLRYLLGQTIEERAFLGNAADLVVAKLPEWTPDGGNIDVYAWYWCTLALHQVGGERWGRWRPAVVHALVAGQSRRGPADGSWDPIGVWGEVGGRVYSTAMATMTLQTPYRYARVVEEQGR